MKASLNPRQIENYRENGFLIYENFLNHNEVSELKSEILTVIETMKNSRITGTGRKLIEADTYFDRVYTQKLNLWRESEIIKSYFNSQELGEMICQLEGIDRFRIWHDQALIKEPFANPTNLHLDNPYWSFYSKNAITIWVALEDVDVVNGCLCFLPQSHKIGSTENVGPTDEFGSLLKLYPQMRSIEPVVAKMKAGDCSFHNGLTAHGAGVNMTLKRRMAMTCAYMPDGSIFNGIQNVLDDNYFNSLKIGDTLNNDIFNPIIPRIASSK